MTNKVETPGTITVTLNNGPLAGQEREITPGGLRQGVVHFWAGEPGASASVVYAYKESTSEWVYIDLDLVPEVLPTTGRIIWYMPTDVQVKKYKQPDASPLPGIVLKVDEKSGKVVAKIFTTDCDFLVADVPYNKKAVAGAWLWPKIEPTKRNLLDILNS